MKRSLRLPFSLLLLIAVFTLLTCRVAVRRFVPRSLTPSAPLNETLLLLAASDASEPQLRKDVDELLDGHFPASAASASFSSGHHRSISIYGRDNHHPRYTLRHPIPARLRLRSPKEYEVFPEFRRHLRDWFRQRRFQPSVMSDLVPLVKTPIDRHNSLPATTARYSSCAVVGNSGILLKREHGELIDSHDMVIRLNNARISGYHRNVGSKTGLSFVNSNILRLCARRDGCFCHPYGESVPMIMYICQAVHFLDYTICNSSHKAPLLITDPRFDLLTARIVKYYSLKRFVEETGKSAEEWGKAHDERMFHYSSGMQAIVLALGICDEVGIFGFGKSSDAKHHYHTNQKAELDLHDYEAEYAFYHDLVERPQVIPFLKDSGFKVPRVVLYH